MQSLANSGNYMPEFANNLSAQDWVDATRNITISAYVESKTLKLVLARELFIETSESKWIVT